MGERHLLTGNHAAAYGAKLARAEVVSVSPEAAREGVCRGASVAQARTVYGALTVRVASGVFLQTR